MAGGSYTGKYVRYRMDNKSFGRFLLSDQVRDLAEKVAKDIAARAKTLSPVDQASAVHMADQFEVVRMGGTMVVQGNPRAMVLVINQDHAAAVNEFGGRNNKRHRMLARAGAAFGDFRGDLGVQSGPNGGTE